MSSWDGSILLYALNTYPCFSLYFPVGTIMNGTSGINNNSDMEKGDRTNYPLHQWIQQDPNSAIIKLEAETINEHPGKCQLLK